jgi:hypothetical protein
VDDFSRAADGARSRHPDSAGSLCITGQHKELRALVSAYETFLATEKRGDMATVYEEALQHPEPAIDPSNRSHRARAQNLFLPRISLGTASG